MYRYLLLVLLATLASVVDASRSSSSFSHARRSLTLKQRDPQLGGLGGVLGGAAGGLNSLLGGVGTGLGLTPPTPSTPATSSVLPPTSTDTSASSASSVPQPTTQIPTQTPAPAPSPSPSPSACGGLLGLGIGCPPPAPTSSDSSPSCGGLLGLGIGCPAPQTSSTPPPVTSNPPAPITSDPAATTPPPSPSPSPTSSCGGLLGLGIGCPPPPSSSSGSSSCDGLLGLGIGCPASSSPVSTPADTSSSPSSSPSPTTSCDGLLGLGIGCPPPSTPTSSANQTTTCGLLGGLFGCSSAIPTPTSLLPNITIAIPTSTVISFPGNGTSLASTVTANVTATPTYSATHTNAYSSNSNYDYLTTVSSLLLNTATPTASPLVSNPDQAPTTLSVLSAAPTAAPSMAPLPSGLPRVILPQPQLDITSVPMSDTLINILFNGSLNWEFVAENADSPGQIFEYFPSVIATSLNMDVGQVQNYELTVYEPTSYTGPQDIAMLRTIWQGYIPSSKVSMLASLISNQKSVFYTDQAGSIPSTLAACVDPTMDLEAISGPTPGGNPGYASNGSNVRQDAIIGVVSSLGAIALLIVAYVGYKAIKKRRERAHRRLSDNVEYVGVRPDGQEFDRDSIGGQRRRSFYYAEDSLRGYQGARVEEDGYNHTVTPMRERRAIRPGAISTPILRESTMNW